MHYNSFNDLAISIMQVCNLVWSKNVNELVSTHGYSQNQIIVWRYPTMSKVFLMPCSSTSNLIVNATLHSELFFVVSQLATLTGHAYRVLYLAVSPDGQVIFYWLTV